jgi:hypothetical protein
MRQSLVCLAEQLGGLRVAEQHARMRCEDRIDVRLVVTCMAQRSRARRAIALRPCLYSISKRLVGCFYDFFFFFCFRCYDRVQNSKLETHLTACVLAARVLVVVRERDTQVV